MGTAPDVLVVEHVVGEANDILHEGRGSAGFAGDPRGDSATGKERAVRLGVIELEVELFGGLVEVGGLNAGSGGIDGNGGVERKGGFKVVVGF